MPDNARNNKQARQATFIFEGTVKKTGSSMIDQVPATDQTAIVTVNQVLEAPKTLAKFGGKDITVQLAGKQKVKPGQSMIFHAQGWIFADSIAVQSIKQQEIKRTHAALLSRGGNPVEHRKNTERQERFDEA